MCGAHSISCAMKRILIILEKIDPIYHEYWENLLEFANYAAKNANRTIMKDHEQSARCLNDYFQAQPLDPEDRRKMAQNSQIIRLSGKSLN